LIWFSGIWCEFCEQMEPWAHATAAEFADRVVFVEKSVDHDRAAAARYGVRGTPTFILIDASGRHLSQFSFQSSATP
jgi:thiol-disulfide isomerase/thioredoxin